MRIAGADGDYELTEEILLGLSQRFPNANVREQVGLMALWLAKNPARRPKRVIRFVETWLKRASPKLRAVPKVIPAWWQSDEGTMRQAELLGMRAKPGEEMRQFRERIMAKMKEAA